MLDKKSSTPLYAQLEEILRGYIADGEWVPSQIIPSENELSKTYGISRMTVRSVITTLVKEGLLYRVQGKGTFVSKSKISAKSPAYTGVREQLEKQGYRTDTRLIRTDVIVPSRNILKALLLEEGETVHYIQRVRYADGEAVSIHESYIPTKLCPVIDQKKIVSEQLCHILKEDDSLSAARVTESLESILATDNEAALLGIDKGYPLLLLKEINQTKAGIRFEYTKIVFRGDKVKLDFEYEID